jgi:multiple antibiotic resistance protein
MDNILTTLTSLLVILNPFALSLYLTGVMREVSSKDFSRILLMASGVSLAVFLVFAMSGTYLLEGVLGVKSNALRLFGGIIFFMVAYGYVTQGFKATLQYRGQLDELPSEIALPFMIGPGTITQSMIVGKEFDTQLTVVILASVVVISYVVVMGFKAIRDRMVGERERVFDRYVNILCRLNGLIIGALSIQMIVHSLQLLWLESPEGV